MGIWTAATWGAWAAPQVGASLRIWKLSIIKSSRRLSSGTALQLLCACRGGGERCKGEHARAHQ
eukprot:1140361-Pelagomonas_calceolata.AAC.3